jgi:hypothetical protein
MQVFVNVSIVRITCGLYEIATAENRLITVENSFPDFFKTA